ncbi:MAG: DNA repair protein RecO [Acidobacteria bacterium]|nr:DNA repair protein RecO [Acidobacteriota bacterium]MBK8150655.1 DNA repair protein RecO [Acidobacteriota bacterium]MBK8811476.1 DNA repair protein RecO [Acidobacteriota bacterium]
MGLHETEALVLKSYALAEADKIVVFLTRTHGIVRGVAKGAKRLTSRFGGSLEPFSVVRIEFFQSGDRELVTVKACEIVESLFDYASDPTVLGRFSYFSEILTSFTPPFDPDDRLFRMTRLCIETAAANPTAADRIVTYFELWVLRLGGYLPTWDSCSICGRTLDSSEDAALRADFRLSCGKCERVRQQSHLPAGIREILATALKYPPKGFIEMTEDREGESAALSGILKRIIGTILGKENFAAGSQK